MLLLCYKLQKITKTLQLITDSVVKIDYKTIKGYGNLVKMCRLITLQTCLYVIIETSLGTIIGYGVFSE